MTVWTIGHSTRALDELIGLLRENGIQRLADVRRYPGSRRHPHFSRESLSRSLADAGIEYVHMPSLGGRRQPEADSQNSAWRNAQFHVYADHMGTLEFRAAIESLVGDSRRTAVMCAEALPWKCHRNLISDDLVRRGHEVIHILGSRSTQPHALNPKAGVEGDRLVYR